MGAILFLPKVVFLHINSIAKLLKWKQPNGGCQGRGNDRVSELNDNKIDQALETMSMS